MFMPRLSRSLAAQSQCGMALCCSLRRIAKFLERDLSQLPARLGALRYGIARLHHAQLGISRKTLQNHIANLKAAIRLCRWPRAVEWPWHSFERPRGRSLYDQLIHRRLRLGLLGFSNTARPPVSILSQYLRQASRPSSPTPPRYSSRSIQTIFINRSLAAGTAPRKLYRAGLRSP